MTKLSIILAVLFSFGFTINFFNDTSKAFEINGETTVTQLLINLGEVPPDHYIMVVDSAKARQGESIVKTGFTVMPDGSPSQKVSNFFTCIDCHNLVKETEYPWDNDPDSRLAYAMESGLPFLPASTFWGMVNRTAWFNDDHIKKYGDLVKPAHKDLGNAIQLCSKECSSGRHLEDWELEAVFHYLTTLQLKVKDLKLTSEELENLKNFDNDELYNKEMVQLVRSKYITAFPATFVEPIPEESRKKGSAGNIENGQAIFELSCLHCHDKNRVCKTVFSPDEKDAGWLVSYFHKNNGGSIYFITRHGTDPSRRTPQYMPIYSKEKLTDQMIEDLAAYLLVKSKEKN